MVTKAQKIEAMSKLLSNPNRKLSSEHLDKIKLNPEPFIKFSGLDNLKFQCVQYDLDGSTIYVRWNIVKASITPTQFKKLEILGFTETLDYLTCYGFTDSDLCSNTNLLRLIQNLTLPIECLIYNCEDIVFNFLSRVERDDFYHRHNARILNGLSIDEARIIDRVLGLGKMLESDDLSGEFDHKGKITFKHDSNGYVIYSEYDLGHTIITDKPLTVIDILKSNEYGDVKTDIMLRYLNLEIDNRLPYESKVAAVDPLIIFNKAVDELQSKDLPLGVLAKELILLSSKHLT